VNVKRVAPVRFLCAVLMLGSVLAISALISVRRSSALARPLESIPSAINGFYSGGDAPIKDRVLARLKADSYLVRTYRSEGSVIYVFVAYYSTQHAGEAMHSPKNCLPGAGWEIMQQRLLQVHSRNRIVTINDDDVQNEGEQMRMLYWYQSPRRVIASDYEEKLMLLWDSVKTGDSQGSLVRLIFPPGGLSPAAEKSFAASMVEAVQQCLTGKNPGT
jgi:EpsI family protein